MIGTAIKKYAELHGMTCDGGYACGKVNGWHIAMLDSYGVKMLQIYLYPPARTVDEETIAQIRRTLEDCDDREYRLIRRGAVNVADGRAVIVFQDGPGAIKRIERYIDEIMPGLDELDLNGDACACCAEHFEDGVRYLRMDDYILPLHSHCMNRMAEQMDMLRPCRNEGSLARGALGAFVGAALGAIPWAIVYAMGYIPGLVGLLIGFLSSFLYGKFGGRNGCGRLSIVLAALLFGMLLGQAGGFAAGFWMDYDDAGGRASVGMSRTQYIQSGFESVFLDDDEALLRNIYNRMKENMPPYEQEHAETMDQFIEANQDSVYMAERRELRSEWLSNFGIGLLLGMVWCVNLFFQRPQSKKAAAPRIWHPQ